MLNPHFFALRRAVEHLSVLSLSPLMQPSRAVPQSIGETITDSFNPAFRPLNWLLLKQVTDMLSSVQGKESG